MRPVESAGVTSYSRMSLAELETILISRKPVANHFAIIYSSWLATFGAATNENGSAR